ncbi:MAG: metallophosphoesterase family protein [Thermoleophilaceae bacterium]
MRSAVISDLHLGTRLESDVLRRPEARARLFEALSGADRVVLLGDVLELRQRPVAEVLDIAAPFLAELGQILDGRPVTIVPGNHDHQLAGGLLERRRVRGESAELGLEERTAPDGSEPLSTLSELMGGANVTLSYPGLWLRPDVYATHGHYLDAHLTVPRIECLAVSVVRRLVGPGPHGGHRPADYERLLGPVYGLAYELAQAASARGAMAATDLNLRVWRRIDTGKGMGAMLLGGVAVPAAVGTLNALGLGPFRARLTSEELRRAGLEAMGRVVGNLGVEAEHVIFGHTHRPGPLDGEAGFELPGGGHLTNTGSWIHNPAFGDATLENPYHPGVVVFVDDEGPPRVERVLSPGDLGDVPWA